VPDLRLPGPIEPSVYFFSSEALTNVAKHARARSASLQVTTQDDWCRIEVRDDGIGGAEPVGNQRPDRLAFPALI
jgi:signal transduction histidine kinase